MRNNILIPKYNHNGTFLRQIRSFVCRKGRITRAQLQAIQKYWSLIGIDFQLKPLSLISIFDNYKAPIVLEIGFGSGKSLVKNAVKFPNKNFLGIEVYKSGIGSCLHFAYSSKINNLRIIYHDAIEVINTMISDRTLSKVQIFFPDPWNKKRHHKRRLLKSSFLEKIAKKLIISGILHIATDSEEYAYYILDEIKNIEKYKNLSKNNTFIKRPIFREITKFEKKGCLQGNKIFDLMFQLKE
ncbi:tRNA (guanosine(46)-N7)-methyltransferase TrmB [Buchnera aphidicola (Hyperomyzus lactucae)]|uniref:tRNA (guanine-N(7)-)-methyltransferase n=1 Tax=Buchnera aphidicola (Hyperomyzus lactucae) TaxID=1241860 RepID=A0A4D6XYX5_9GAMM|nr:tRNA (guanosine(46)-N7)-methyltransferase TrmB [Buchnera aphidicola]QCI21259.1 tRNA (guanosine(46)-N7)-methyltransferase TrmB [Buchnera aphidicola (Hyperomyzus lactucae)]